MEDPLCNSSFGSMVSLTMSHPTHMKERAEPTAGKSSGLTVREMEKGASENPRCVRESDVSFQGEEARIERPCWSKW